jgi:ankyrin repeat protein
MLLEHGASPNTDNDADCKECTLLSAAFTLHRTQFARLLLTRNVDRTYFNQEQYSLLDECAHRGDVEMMQVLLDNGADINHKRFSIKYTPLMTAATGGNVKSVRFLLAHHAAPELKCDWGLTALQIVRHSRHANSQVIALLVEAEHKAKESHAR